MAKPHYYEAGTLLVLYESEHPQDVHDIYVVRAPFDLECAAADWIAAVKAGEAPISAWSRRDFTSWLCGRGLLTQARYQECHIGSYNALSVGAVDADLDELIKARNANLDHDEGGALGPEETLKGATP